MNREEFVVQQEANRQRKLFESLIESMGRTETWQDRLDEFRREQAPTPPDTFDVQSLAAYTIAKNGFGEEESRLSSELRNELVNLNRLKADVLDLLPVDVPLIYDYGTHGGIANYLGAYEIRSTKSGDDMSVEIRRVGNPKT